MDTHPNERLYSFEELTQIGSELYNLGEEGRKAATALVERTDRILRTLSEKERKEWTRKADEFATASRIKEK